MCADEILKSDLALWLNPSETVLAFASFNYSLVRRVPLVTLDPAADTDSAFYFETVSCASKHRMAIK